MKSIAIIGGGISGLAALHYLNQRFTNNVSITLYECNAVVGGNVQSVMTDGFLFEKGPNGFLTNQPNTLAFLKELNLLDQTITASYKAKRRYVQVNGQLNAFPLDPLSMINFKPLSIGDKCRLLGELLQPKADNSHETIHDFVTRRCGAAVADYLVDPFVTGVFAGDSKLLHMASAFPKMAALENNYGSLIKAMFLEPNNNKPVMTSLALGMGQVIEALSQRYASQIKCGVTIQSLDEITSDHLIMTIPAYAASRLLLERSATLAGLLDSIPYVPVAVVGVGIDIKALKKIPDGFGYLIPSNQHKEILGVLIESNVYVNRAPSNHVMFRVMMGGRHHPSIINDDPALLLNKALAAIDLSYGLIGKPVMTHVQLWPKAIPQYEKNYPRIRQGITNEVSRMKGISLAGNYLDGISFNDTINNAKLIAQSITL